MRLWRSSPASDQELREFALRACDRKNDVTGSAQPYVSALTDPNPRVRLVAAWGLGRLGMADAAALAASAYWAIRISSSLT